MADIAVTPSLVKPLPGARTERFMAGGSGSVGDTVYVDSAGKVQVADASVAGTAHAIGVAASAPGGKTTFVLNDSLDVVMDGKITGFSGMTPGDILYQSDTAAKLGDAAGTVSHKMGKPLSATVLWLRPGDEEA